MSISLLWRCAGVGIPDRNESFLDGCEGIIDLGPLIAKGEIWSWLPHPESLARLRVDEYGHGFTWAAHGGCDIDRSADGLRRDCECRAEIHKLMVS